MSKKKQIQFQISEIRRTSHFENNFKDFGLEQKDILSGKVEINVKMGTDEKNNRVIFKVDVVFYIKKEERKIDLFGVGAIHTFTVRNMSKVFPKDENQKLLIPENFMLNMLNAIVGCTRGMLVLSRTNLEYLNIYLPVVNVKQLGATVEPLENIQYFLPS